MHDDELDKANSPAPLRIWPAILILAATPVFTFLPGLLLPRTMVHFASFFAAPVLGTLALMVWWAFAARVRGRERWLFPLLIVGPAVALTVALFPSAPMAVPVYAMPLVAGAWAIGACAWSRSGAATRASILFGVLGVGWTVVGLLRFDGADADLSPQFRWRWHPTEEELFLAEKPDPVGGDAAPVVVGPGDWPGFRGPNRDSRRTGVSIDTDWEAHPPELMWKHRIGPGWGSFAVAGGKLFTQEQRGPDEAVVCYAADSGREVWEHREPTRFDEAIGGAGPRATPTIHEGRLYAQGATGKLVCLDAATGRPHWTADLKEAGGVVPQWGYAGSPLVIQRLVVVYLGGPDGKGTAAYSTETGKLVWTSGRALHSYSSAQAAELGGVPQVLMVSDYGIESFRPEDGRALWEHNWLEKGMNRVVQPIVIGESDIVITTGVGSNQGIRRLRITKRGDTWNVEPLWTTKAIRPYFNDGVVHDGLLFGFDDARFCCIDLKDGREVWKEGQYGHGQVLLLADQSLLLLQAVDGRVVLLKATAEDQIEVGKFAALKGKTWNHPVVAHGMLFVRNGQETAGYRLRPK